MSEPQFEPVPAAEGTAITITVNDEERELKATKGKSGWAIRPKDQFEAAALEKLGPEALDPPAPPEPEPDQAAVPATPAEEAAAFAAVKAEAADQEESTP